MTSCGVSQFLIGSEKCESEETGLSLLLISLISLGRIKVGAVV